MVRHVLHVYFAAIIALLLVALALGTVLAISVIVQPSDMLPPRSAFVSGIAVALVSGALPVLVLGAPAYAVLSRRRRPAWPVVLLLGAVAGTTVAVVSRHLLGHGVACGIAVAAITHLACGRMRCSGARVGRRAGRDVDRGQ